MTAEEYIESKINDVLCGNGYDEMIHKKDALEAIRLSKIEALEDQVNLLEGKKFNRNTSIEMLSHDLGIDTCKEVLTSQINQLKNGK